MFDQDKWQEILETIWKNKLRTAATAFGIFWGITMLVVLLGAGQGLQNGVLKEVVLDATNSIWFFSQKTSLPFKGRPAGRQITFTEKDLAAIKETIPGIEFIAAENSLQGQFNVVNGQKSGNFQVLGSGEDYFNIKIYQEYLAGRKLNLYDHLEERKVCVIGDRVAEVLFEQAKSPIGAYINIKGVMFKVVGLFHDDGWGGQFSQRIYVPISSFQRTFNPTRTVQLFAVTSQKNTTSFDLQQEILRLLKERQQIHPDDQQALWSHNQEEQYKSFKNLFAGIKGFVWFVGISTLVAGIVGVSNIMLIVVKERTSEFGIRKAIGATPFSIVSMLIQESLLITTVAGYIGILSGVGLLQGLNTFMTVTGAEIRYFKDPEVNLTVVVAAFAVLVVAGVIAGLFPALKASRITPIEALRID